MMSFSANQHKVFISPYVKTICILLTEKLNVSQNYSVPLCEFLMANRIYNKR